MRHTDFKAKNSSFNVIGTSSNNAKIWTFTLDDGLVAQDDATLDAIGDYYSASISTPDKDCFMFVKYNNRCAILRVGDPEVLVIAYIGSEGETISYKQLDMDGKSIDDGDMTEIDEGFYYIEPSSTDKSFFDMGNGIIISLVVPYNVVTVNGTNCLTSDGIFHNVGYNMFGFLGNKNSYYDLDNKKWIDDDNAEAKSSDLAKAVCGKYGLVWDDQDDDKWIGNYIKYLRSYTENDGKIRYYKPSVTPENNDANFSLIQEDEAGNLVVRGIDIYILQSLESVDGTDGVTITFKES